VEAFHGPSYFMNLGSPSATSWVAALLCRLACLRVLPFRHLSIQLEFRYLLFWNVRQTVTFITLYV
jgi:hypothetical protein